MHHALFLQIIMVIISDLEAMFENGRAILSSQSLLVYRAYLRTISWMRNIKKFFLIEV